MARVSKILGKKKPMIAIILAGGYGKRLWPVTRDVAKPLLPVAGKPLIDHLMEKLMPLKGAVGEVWVLTNEKFKGQFEEWTQKWQHLNVKVISDGSSCEDEKPGAIGALAKIAPLISEDFLIVAGDCIYEDRLDDFLKFFMEKRKPVIAVYRAKTMDQVIRGSAVSLSTDGRIVSFAEKPKKPSTDLVGAVVYAFPARIRDRLMEYADLELPRDEPGRFMEWLHKVEEAYGYLLKGDVWDIGTPEAYAKAEEMLNRRT